MRVLLLSDFGPPLKGGLESHVGALATELANCGIEVHWATIAPSTIGDNRITLHRVDTTAAALVSYADPARPFHIPMRDPRAHRSISALLDAIAPDVVHAHTWIAASVSRRSGVPLVVTAHDYSFICQLRTLLRPSNVQCDGPGFAKCIGCGRHQAGLARSAALTTATLIGRGRLKPDAVIAVSAHVADRLRPYLGSSVQVIPNFVDPTALVADLDTTPVPIVQPFVLFAGDPSPNKGLEHLLDMWGSSTPPPARLLVATTRPFERALPPGVSTQQLTRRELFGALERARALVVPSLWEDPCPTVVLEAFYAGTPVVAYASGGVPELITDGVEGLLAPTGDVHRLRDAIELVLADDDLASAMGSRARRASAEFDVRVGAKRTVAVYESVLEKAGWSTP